MDCRCRRRRPLDHHVIAGDLQDTEAMRALLGLLPTTAYGQVFLALDAAQIRDGAADDLASRLGLPPRMSLMVLSIPEAPNPAARTAARDAALATAISRWVAEWIPDEVAVDRLVSMWVGGCGCTTLDTVCGAFPHMLQRL